MEKTKEKAWKLKRLSSTIICMWYHFLLGVEYTAVVVSLLYYLKQYFPDIADTMYSVVTAAIFLPAFLAGYIGKLVDRSGELKEWMCFLLVLIIIGNFIYSLYYSIAFLVIGRIAAGFSICLRSAISGEFVRWYDDQEERDSILFYFQLTFCVGFIIGPGAATLFVDVNFYIDSWHLSKLNFIGVFLALLYLATLLATIFGVYNLSKKDLDTKGRIVTNDLSITDVIKDIEICLVIIGNSFCVFTACSLDLIIIMVGRDTLNLSLFNLSLSIFIASGFFFIFILFLWPKMFSGDINALYGLSFCLVSGSSACIVLLIPKMVNIETVPAKMILIIVLMFVNSLAGVTSEVPARELLFQLVPEDSASYIDGVRTGICFPIFTVVGTLLATSMYKTIDYTLPILCLVLLFLCIPLMKRKKVFLQRIRNQPTSSYTIIFTD